jgi:DNA-directed RNA polymerase subunit RPC12/RpoP
MARQDPPPPTEAENGPTQRVRISCPGCGRHDYVEWPQGQPTYHWKCFNCGKEFELTRHGRH